MGIKIVKPQLLSEEIVKIDKLDRRILFLLQKDARISFSQIGKNLHLSKQAIKNRVERLERLEIINDILKLPKLLWLAELHGIWDIAAIFLTNKLTEAEENIDYIKRKYSTEIKKHAFSISTTHSRYTYGFLTGSKDGYGISMGRELRGVELNPTERKVLSILAQHGRIPVTSLAAKLKKPSSTVRNIIARLKQKKVLLGFSTLIDLKKIGFIHHKVYFEFRNAKNQDIKKLITYFKLHPNIVFMNKSLGPADLECEIVTKTLSEFKKILSDIKHEHINFIEDAQSYIVIEEYQTNYYPVY